jgi:leucyl/phenylalanyl-tRNA--protein transferase
MAGDGTEGMAMRPLTSDLLLRAYAMGVFPMARSRHDPRLYWIDPEERGILPLHAFHISNSLKKTLRRDRFEVTWDTAFADVMQGCAEPAAGRDDTWINDDIVRLFTELHQIGLAHSVEVRVDGRLVGGIYGLGMGAAFFGESMFSRVTDASKVALVYLVARLRKSGFMLLDTQFVTPHLQRFGAVEIPRLDFLQLLTRALDVPALLHCGPVSWEEALTP